MAGESPELQRVVRATEARRRAGKRAAEAMAEQHAAIAAALAARVKQADIVTATGLTRERIRQLGLPVPAPGSEGLPAAREQITGGTLLDDLRASLSAAASKPPPEVACKHPKTRVIKGLCGVCGTGGL